APGFADVSREQFERNLAAFLQAPEVLGSPIGSLVRRKDADSRAHHEQAKNQGNHELDEAYPGLACAPRTGHPDVLAIHRALTVTTWRVELPSPVPLGSSSPSAAALSSPLLALPPRLSSHWMVTVQVAPP